MDSSRLTVSSKLRDEAGGCSGRDMTMMRIRKGLVLLAVGALTLTACGGDDDGGAGSQETAEGIDFSATPEGTVKTMGFNPSDEVGSSRSDLAEERLDGVTVDMDTANFDPQKFAALSASGDLPDVVQMDRNTIATFAQKGLIMPLGECFAAQDVNPEEYWYPAVVQEASWDGDVYGAPQFFQPGMIIINTRVADAAGVVPEEIDTSQPDQLVEVTEKMTTMSGAQPTTLGFDPDMPGSTTTWIEVFGGSVMDEEGKPTLDDSKNVEALQWLGEIMDAQGGYPEVTSFKQTWDVFGAENQYVADQVGAALWAQWYINVLADTKDEVELTSQPVRDVDGNVFALAGGTALAIPTQAENPVAGCEWITTVTGLDAWEAAGDARAQTVIENDSVNTGLFTGSPVADQAVRDAHVVETGNESFDQLIATSYETLADVRTVGVSPVGQAINSALQNAAGAALSGEQSAEDALSDAQDTAMREWDGLDS